MDQPHHQKPIAIPQDNGGMTKDSSQSDSKIIRPTIPTEAQVGGQGRAVAKEGLLALLAQCELLGTASPYTAQVKPHLLSLPLPHPRS